MLSSDGKSNSFITRPIEVKDNSIENLLQKLYENDFVETQLERSQNKMAIYYDNLSKNDRSFLNLMNEKAKLVDGHYVLPLPFKDANAVLPKDANVVFIFYSVRRPGLLT